MIYINEFEFFESEGMVCAVPFGLEGGTCGANLEEAVYMAADWLYETVKYDLIHGVRPRCGGFGNEPRQGGKVIAVSVNCDLSQVEAVSSVRAASLLGVSAARVAQMCAKDQLISWKENGRRMILMESIQARMAEAPKPGRPQKKAAAL